MRSSSLAFASAVLGAFSFLPSIAVADDAIANSAIADHPASDNGCAESANAYRAAPAKHGKRPFRPRRSIELVATGALFDALGVGGVVVGTFMTIAARPDPFGTERLSCPWFDANANAQCEGAIAAEHENVGLKNAGIAVAIAGVVAIVIGTPLIIYGAPPASPAIPTVTAGAGSVSFEWKF
jgi:hypothetical protein